MLMLYLIEDALTTEEKSIYWKMRRFTIRDVIPKESESMCE